MVENLDDWAVWFDPNELCKADVLDDDSSFNTFIRGSFFVQNLVTKEFIEIKTDEDRQMFLTDDALRLLKKGKGYIRFKDMEDDTMILQMEINNNELTKPLYSS